MCILNYFVATLFKDYFQQLDRAAILKCTSGCLLLTVLVVVVVAVVNFERAWIPYDQRYQHTFFMDLHNYDKRGIWNISILKKI